MFGRFSRALRMHTLGMGKVPINLHGALADWAIAKHAGIENFDGGICVAFASQLVNEGCQNVVPSKTNRLGIAGVTPPTEERQYLRYG
jgi:hypothetical protein